MRPVAVKLVGVFPGNVALGLEPHPAVICLLDPSTGACLALMDGEHITGLRTAAGAALSTRALAREDASVLAIVGAGVQARRTCGCCRSCGTSPRCASSPVTRPPPSGVADHAHRRAAPRGRPRRPPRVARPSPRVVAAATADGADVVCLTTSSSVPVLSLAEVAPGTHVTSVGFAPPGGELDPALAAAARLFVETRQAFSPPPAGCAELAGLDPAAATELGELLSGRASGRTSPPRSPSTRRWATSPRTPRPPSSSIAPRSSRASGAPWTSEPSLVVVGACAAAPPRLSTSRPSDAVRVAVSTEELSVQDAVTGRVRVGRPLSRRSEAALVRSAQGGSAEAAEELFRRHWPAAHRAAWLVVHDAAAAEDIAQEAFMSAFRSLGRFDRRRPLGPWLHRIVVNRAIDWSRSRALRPETGSDALPEPVAPEATGELGEGIVAALADLGPEHRAVVVLRHLLGYTPGEIAAILELPRGTVNSRLRRALDALSLVLEDER